MYLCRDLSLLVFKAVLCCCISGNFILQLCGISLANLKINPLNLIKELFVSLSLFGMSVY